MRFKMPGNVSNLSLSSRSIVVIRKMGPFTILNKTREKQENNSSSENVND